MADDLLFLAHRIPYPPNKGDKIRSWNILRHLTERHRVHLGCLLDDPHDRQYIPELERHCASVFTAAIDPLRQRLLAMLATRPGQPLSTGYFRTRALSRWVRDTIDRQRIDRAFVFSTPMMASLPADRSIRTVLDMVDVDSEKWRQMSLTARVPQRWIYAREARTLLAYERRVAAFAERTLFVSRQEMELFLARAPEARSRTDWMANGVDTEYFSPAHRFASPYPDKRPVIVFTGDMAYWPNVEAVTWFTEQVLPMLAERPIPPLFVIAGGRPTEEVRRLAGPDVLVTGRVEDIRPYVANADAVVAPLMLARGIQNKVLEGMAMAKVVIATPQAETGLDVSDDGGVLIAADPAAFAARVAETLDGQHGTVGERARRIVTARFGWNARLGLLDALFAETPAARVRVG